MHWWYENKKFELDNAKVKKTVLLSYNCKYWLIINIL